ncbi:hypothetical protein fugu_003065 [Takifugu bimaculatus]|uniref:SH3 domain-containing protein n=1 Tax=Takifugu bimaculatus TaxID=433685 RepID=A0A4Z2BGU6_9TELE|nr:hypothetical protein fugu_003065 [Takifugu bimaculatus]
MADREKRKASPPSGRSARLNSPASFRLTHDISLDEFEDDDLSEITEITDERGMSLNCNGPDLKGRMRRGTNSVSGRAELGAVGQLQAEMLHLELIDGADGFRGDIDSSKPSIIAAPVLIKDPAAPVTMDTYRPKRPTTLNLFPIVPRTQDTLNNNSFGKKYSWQEKVSGSSSPLKAGELTPPREHSCLSDEDKVQGSGAQTKDRGTSTDAPCRHSHSSSTATRPKLQERPPAPPPPPQNYTPAPAYPAGRADGAPDTEGPPPYQPLPDRTNPSIYEEDEVYVPAPSYASCVESLITPPSSSLPACSSLALDLSLKSEGTGAGVMLRAGSSVEYVDATDESYCGEDEDVDRLIMDGSIGTRGGKVDGGSGRIPRRTSMNSEASGLSYDAVKYTLVVDEHAQLELVSLRECYQGYSDDSDSATVYDNCVSSPYESAIGEDYEEEEEDGAHMGGVRREATASLSEESTPELDLHFSKKFLNVFMNGRSRSSSAESFGLYSCVIHGEEKDQSHRAVYRFVPRHDDELELEVDDPLLVEVQSEDYWYEGYNMRTGARGIFPAYYAIEVSKDPEIYRVKSSEWMDRYRLKFLGSVQVPYHKGNDVLCAAMQKSNECNHFFQLKNVSFCGYHPKNNKYFGFITKHPADHRFACHVFVSEDSTKAVAESVGKAFQLYYKEVCGGFVPNRGHLPGVTRPAFDHSPVQYTVS